MANTSKANSILEAAYALLSFCSGAILIKINLGKGLKQEKTMQRKLLLSALLASIGTSATASTELETVTVNADFRETTLNETPSSVSVVESIEIQKRGAQHLENITGLTPNVNSAGGASRNKYFQIRGIGERSQYNTPLNPSVGLTIDGIDYSRSGAAGTLFDVQQVEVLRGPQGTRFGANALAGMINIQSNQPTEELEAHVEHTLGSDGLQGAGVAVGGSISENVLGRFSVYKNTADGYMTNTYLEREDTQNIDELTSRAQIKWLVDDNLTVDFKAIHLDIDNGFDAFSFENDFTTSTDEPGTDAIKSDALAIGTDWKMTPAVTMQTNLTYSNSDLLYSYDDDWTYDGQYEGGYSAKDNYYRKRENYSLDLRWLSSEQGRIFNNTTEWVVGIYHFQQDESLHRIYEYLPEGEASSQYDTTNTAIYGQLDYHLNKRTLITAGLRTEHFKADYTNSDGFTEKTDEILFGGKLGLEYQVSAQHRAFTSLSRGYKAGGVNDDSTLPDDQIAFDTEYLWNLEAGVNSSFLNNKLKTRLTAFYSLRKDQQVNSSTQEEGSQNFIIYLDNAAQGKHYGLELEADWAFNRQLSLMGSLGLLDATFTDYTYVDPNDTTSTVSLDGREQAHAPNYQFSIGGEYYFAQNWTLSANIEGKDAFYFSNSHDLESESFHLVNASLEYTTGDWVFTLWARNLADTKYDTRGFYFGIDPRTGYSDNLYTQKGEPRTIGLTIAWDY